MCRTVAVVELQRARRSPRTTLCRRRCSACPRATPALGCSRCALPWRPESQSCMHPRCAAYSVLAADLGGCAPRLVLQNGIQTLAAHHIPNDRSAAPTFCTRSSGYLPCATPARSSARPQSCAGCATRACCPSLRAWLRYDQSSSRKSDCAPLPWSEFAALHTPSRESEHSTVVGRLSELCEAPLIRVLADNVRASKRLAAARGIGTDGDGKIAQSRVAALSGNVLADSLFVSGGESTGLSWRHGLLAIATDVAKALAFLHERGFAHGGLLLHDVMLDGGWRAKLCEYRMDALRGGRGLGGSTLELLSPKHSARLPSSAVLFLPPERCSGRAAEFTAEAKRHAAEVAAHAADEHRAADSESEALLASMSSAEAPSVAARRQRLAAAKRQAAAPPSVPSRRARRSSISAALPALPRSWLSWRLPPRSTSGA